MEIPDMPDKESRLKAPEKPKLEAKLLELDTKFKAL